MLHHPTVDKLHALRLSGMAAALAEQQAQEGIDRLGFEERLGLLVEREASQRESRQTTARLRRAKLKFSGASPEDIDYRTARGLDRALTARLLTCEWIRERQNLILVAPTGLGKSWLGCAFAVQACRQGFSACSRRAVGSSYRSVRSAAAARGTLSTRSMAQSSRGLRLQSLARTQTV
ncbi:ATP-binding protein [Caballeronia jiangsuensis]|uniref:ATP-binding protein n=1 Tax=Caballeronia jiangsuensis TaxID=1458357 RepID=A0ABW9CYY5_9BURK